MDGWIKLLRQLIWWEWYKDSNTLHLFIHLLLMACYKPSKWRGVDLAPGQLITGRKQLSAETGISERSIRTSLGRLKKTGEICVKSTSNFSIVTVCNYSKYQSCLDEGDQQSDQAAPKLCPSDDHIQEVKKEKKEKKSSFVETSDEFRLARYLFSCIRKNKPDFKQPNLQTWAKHIDYMLRLDHRAPEEVREVIKWTQSDNQPDERGFCWAVNVLSTKKLRQQYDQLSMRMKSATISGESNAYIPIEEVLPQ